MKNHRNLLTDERGFTLIEIISVLIILGVLSAVAVPKYIELEETVKNRAIDAAIAELNVREKLVWAKQLLSGTYKDDVSLYNSMILPEIEGYDLGDEYEWMSDTIPSATVVPYPDISVGFGILNFQKMKTSVVLNRSPSAPTYPAVWTRAVIP